MERIAMSARFQGEAPEPAGEPPETHPRAISLTIEAAAADGSPYDLGSASYLNHAIFTSESTFTETGTISFEGAGELDIDTAGEGTIGPSPEPGVLHGAVIWRIADGRGRFEGATGLITSNFLLRTTGEFDERQVGVLFLP
jgi:hypothetical protein